MNRNKFLSITISMFATLFVFSCQDENKSESIKESSNIKMSESENETKDVMLNLLDLEMYFTNASSVGSERANDPKLKEISLIAKEAHQNNYEKLKLICEEKGYQVPEKLSKESNANLFKLTITNSADFDNYYIENVSKEYKTIIDSTAKIINENTYVDVIDVLTVLESNYRKKLENLERINDK